MKATAQWFATALILMLSASLWADDAPKEVHIDLSIEDINDWAVEDDTLWLQLTGPAQARVNTQLATEPADTRFSVHFEGRELMAVGAYISNNSSFSPINYGYKKLSDLVKASELFEVQTHNKAVHIRDNRAK